MVTRLWIAALMILGIAIALPYITPNQPAAYSAEKKHAVRLAQDARQLIGERILGVEYSETTTSLGHKDAKILSAAPDFPALLVQWLKEAGIRQGDVVAINASGSFPALTIAALAAVKAVGAKSLMISSLGASSWGANRPEYTWLHMERELLQRWPEYKSIAVSLGGDNDLAHGLFDEGTKALQDAVTLTDAPQLIPQTAADVVQLRIAHWLRHNDDHLPALLINIGGNVAFWGTRDRDRIRQEGLQIPNPQHTVTRDGVGDMFLKAGKPVIHLLGIKQIAAQYQITIPPSAASPLWITPKISHTARGLLILLLASLLAGLMRFRKLFTE